MLHEAGDKVAIYDYSDLAEYTFGVWGTITFDYAVILGGFGSQLAYVIVVGETLSVLLTTWGCDSPWCGNSAISILVTIFLLAPLCLLRHFGHFAIASVFSVGVVVAVMFLVLIGGPIDRVHGEPVRILDWHGTLRSLGSIIFTLSFSVANFQAFLTTEKVHQNARSWNSITGIVVLVGATMCLAMGLTGYLSFREETKGEILDNFSGNIFDVFKLAIICHFILYIPTNIIIVRYSVVKVSFGGMQSENLSWTAHLLLTLFILALTTGTGITLVCVS